MKNEFLLLYFCTTGIYKFIIPYLNQKAQLSLSFFCNKILVY